MKKHEPAIFDKVAKVLLPKDYVRLPHDRRICLRHVGFVRHLLARRCKARNGRMTCSRPPTCARDQMPKLYRRHRGDGPAHAAVAKAWGMPKRPVVAGGGGDNPASACGIGAVTARCGLRVDRHVGRASSSPTTTSRPNTARAVHAFCHAVPDTWHQMGVILSAAASLEWLAGLLKTPAPKLTAALGDKTRRAFIGAVPALSFRRAHAGGRCPGPRPHDGAWP